MLHQRKRGGAAASHIIRCDPGGAAGLVVGAALILNPGGAAVMDAKKTTGGRWSFLVVWVRNREGGGAVMEAARRVIFHSERLRPSGRGRGCCSHPEPRRVW